MANKKDKPKRNHEKSVLEVMAEEKERARVHMAYVRSFKKPHKPSKYTDEFVSDCRTAYVAAKNLKGFHVRHLSSLMGIPIMTLRDFLWRKGMRTNPAAQVNDHRISFWRARITAILLEHKRLEDELKRDRHSARHSDDPLTTAERMKLSTEEKHQPLEIGITEEEITARHQAQEDERIFRKVDAIIGRPPISINDVVEAVNHYARTSGNFMSYAELIDLRRKYAQHHNLY